MKPDRVVIGCNSERGRKVMNELYAPYVRQGNPIIFMDERSAELTKYAANSFLATKITFMNEISNLCEKVGADVDLIRKGIGSDFRIGKHFLYAGCGYGGSCFPKDVQALEQTSKDYDYDFKIINSVIEVNEYQKLIMIRKIKEHYNNELRGKKVAIWGLAFKPNTDDVREAPALYVINELLDAGAEVSVYDPEAIENVKGIFGDRIHYADDQYGVLPGSDFLLILTEWGAFRTPDFKKIRELLKSPVIFDGRNIFTLEQMSELGFYYNSIGRKTIGVNKEVLNGNV
jgi:UDPglucose 6-dehydrogenase